MSTKVIKMHKLRSIKSTNKASWITLWPELSWFHFWNFHNRFPGEPGSKGDEGRWEEVLVDGMEEEGRSKLNAQFLRTEKKQVKFKCF